MHFSKVRYLPKPRAFHLQWHITERCNLRCTHCYQEDKYIRDELDTEQLFGVLDQFISLLRLWGIPREFAFLSLTGGEPFIREDFFKLLERCFKNIDRFRYNILTNGLFINRETAKKLKDLGLNNVQVSLEGMEEVNDSIRGKGTFRKIIRAVGLLTGEGIHTAVSLTVHKGNVNEIPEVVELCKDLGVNHLQVDRLVPQGRGTAFKSEMLEPKEVKRLYEYLHREHEGFKKGGKPLRISDNRSLWPLITHKQEHMGCLVSEGRLLIVMPNGDIFPCRRLPVKVGNLTQKNLCEIWYSSNKLWELRDKSNWSLSCRRCPYFDGCGGCIAVAYAYSGDLFAPDPQCWRLFDKLPSHKELKKHQRGASPKKSNKVQLAKSLSTKKNGNLQDRPRGGFKQAWR